MYALTPKICRLVPQLIHMDMVFANACWCCCSCSCTGIVGFGVAKQRRWNWKATQCIKNELYVTWVVTTKTFGGPKQCVCVCVRVLVQLACWNKSKEKKGYVPRNICAWRDVRIFNFLLRLRLCIDLCVCVFVNVLCFLRKSLSRYKYLCAWSPSVCSRKTPIL